MKSGRSDKELVSSVMARADSLGESDGHDQEELLELARAYLRLEERLGKIIAIGDKYQAEALMSAGRLRDALERIESLERGSERAPARGLPAEADTNPEGKVTTEGRRDYDPLLGRIRKAIGEGSLGGLSLADVGILLRRYERLDARLDKIVRISDSYQGQLRDATTRMDFMARTDALTGLANRRDIIERLERELGRLDRYGTVFSVILFDMDDFKGINDRYGHNAGDKALKMAAYIFERELRKTDSCGRWGGEEFLVLCPETKAAEAFHVAEKCRREIAASSMETPEGEVRFTLSGGVFGAEKGLDIDAIVKRADEALYAAKAAGKDSITLWTKG